MEKSNPVHPVLRCEILDAPAEDSQNLTTDYTDHTDGIGEGIDSIRVLRVIRGGGFFLLPGGMAACRPCSEGCCVAWLSEARDIWGHHRMALT